MKYSDFIALQDYFLFLPPTRSTREGLNVLLQVVLLQELDLLELNKFWKYPKSKYPLLWLAMDDVSTKWNTNKK
jgi:hypothetical protein